MLLRLPPRPPNELGHLVQDLPLATDDVPAFTAALERELRWYRNEKAAQEHPQPPRFRPMPTRLFKQLRQWAQQDPQGLEEALGLSADLYLPAKPGPKSLDRDLVDRVLMLLQIYGVRPARGDKFQWLKQFLKELCAIAGADRPNIDRALEIHAKERAHRAAP
jgi:hypothetical protein